LVIFRSNIITNTTGFTTLRNNISEIESAAENSIPESSKTSSVCDNIASENNQILIENGVIKKELVENGVSHIDVIEDSVIEQSITEISIVTNPPELQSLQKSETSIESNVTVVENEVNLNPNQNKTTHDSDQDTVASVSELAETDSDPLQNNQLQSIAASDNSIPQSIVEDLAISSLEPKQFDTLELDTHKIDTEELGTVKIDAQNIGKELDTQQIDTTQKSPKLENP
jgi:transcriptional regulator